MIYATPTTGITTQMNPYKKSLKLFSINYLIVSIKNIKVMKHRVIRNGTHQASFSLVASSGI